MNFRNEKIIPSDLVSFNLMQILNIKNNHKTIQRFFRLMVFKPLSTIFQ